ncbi:MAG: tetraacyldisaccharide 4'-kinase [Porticoccaceae bacterium]|nr:tetraacyldisaccharide 4'-kinase [Porticoccaceae bacterium]
MTTAWYANSAWLFPLRPLSAVFQTFGALRRRYLLWRYRLRRYSAPVVVVGNIAIGGSGKTPLLIALVKYLAAHGFNPGVVSRGYKGSRCSGPMMVMADSDVVKTGDEALLIARSCSCSVVVDSDRHRAVKYLLENSHCDVVLSDDGLQHYAMPRDIEIAVIDGSRGFGNRLCLPAGPLREPPSRLSSVDFIAVNGAGRLDNAASEHSSFNLVPVRFVNLLSGESCLASEWSGTTSVHAVAAIGAPQRFAATLGSLGLNVRLHAHGDHRTLSPSDLCFKDKLDVIITAKDAIKLNASDRVNLWYLEVAATIDDQFAEDLVARLTTMRRDV